MLLLLFAIALWAGSLGQIDVREINDLGLISVLPIPFFVAIAILSVSFGILIQQPSLRTTLLLAHIIVLIVILFGTTTLVEDAPRFAATWKHIGIAEYISRNESLDPNIDAYFNWPGFFVLVALFSETAGLQSASSLAGWSSVYFNLLYLCPLLMFMRSATRDTRLVWLGIWLFYLTNWIGQDYFAPQAFNYFLYLVVIAVLLTWFKASSARWHVTTRLIRRVQSHIPRCSHYVELLLKRDTENQSASSGQRMALLAMVILIFAVMVPSHQLTPVVAIASVSMLVLSSWISPRGLPIVMALIFTAWLAFVAVPFLTGHSEGVVGGIGKVDQNVNASVGDRLRGSADHLVVVRMRLVMTLAVVFLAMLGGLRRLWAGFVDQTMILCAISPVTMLGVQQYGGELLLRVYFLSLPALAFLAAASFFPRPAVAATWRTASAIGAVSLLLFAGFLFARYGNERMDYYTADEMASLEYVYEIAEPGSLLLAGSQSIPWKFEKYELVREVAIGNAMVRDVDVDGVASLLESHERSHDAVAYFIVTRSTKAGMDLFSGLPAGSLDRLETALKASPRLTVIYSNPDATIFRLTTSVSSGTLP